MPTKRGKYSSDDMGKDPVRQDRTVDETGTRKDRPRSIADWIEENSGQAGRITKDR